MLAIKRRGKCKMLPENFVKETYKCTACCYIKGSGCTLTTRLLKDHSHFVMCIIDNQNPSAKWILQPIKGKA
jgi:hypothetical protein